MKGNEEALLPPLAWNFLERCVLNWCIFIFTSWPDHTELGEKRPKESEGSAGQPPPLTSESVSPNCTTREDGDD